MKITLHGKLAEDFGKIHQIEATSIADAITGLTKQLKFYNDVTIDKRPVIKIVGYDTEESLNECPEEIHLVPAIAGGKGAGKILLGAALVGLSFTGIGAFAGGMLANAMFGIGLGLALTGIAEIFTKAPSLSKQSDPEASAYLGLSNNTTKLGTLRSYSMGRVKLTAPHLLALNVDSTDLVRGEFPE